MLVSCRFALLRSLGILGVVLMLLMFASARPAHGLLANAITVNSTADDNTVNGNCTLREAIIAANTNTAVDHCFGNGGGLDDVIRFDIGSGTPEIDIGATALPDITERVRSKGTAEAPTKFSFTAWEAARLATPTGSQSMRRRRVRRSTTW